MIEYCRHYDFEKPEMVGLYSKPSPEVLRAEEHRKMWRIRNHTLGWLYSDSGYLSEKDDGRLFRELIHSSSAHKLRRFTGDPKKYSFFRVLSEVLQRSEYDTPRLYGFLEDYKYVLENGLGNSNKTQKDTDWMYSPYPGNKWLT